MPSAAAIVPPAELEKLRLAGDRTIPPDADTIKQATGSGKELLRGSFKVCLDTQGAVSSVSLLKSTGFAAYDQHITAQLETWRFRPYERDGASQAVCTALTFDHALKPSATKTPTGGYWCSRWAGKDAASTAGSACRRTETDCDRGRNATRNMVTAPSECEWQERAWASSIKTDGKNESWLFAEQEHCEATALTFRGTKCRQVK